MIQALAAQTADEALAKCIRSRCPRGCFEYIDTAGSCGKVLSELAIPITDQVFGFCILGRGCAQLLGHPLVSGVSGDAGMYDATSMQLHDNEDVNGPEEQIMNHGEITSPDILEMVLDESGPGLA